LTVNRKKAEDGLKGKYYTLFLKVKQDTCIGGICTSGKIADRKDFGCSKESRLAWKSVFSIAY
jgi:hypothetical protein